MKCNVCNHLRKNQLNDQIYPIFFHNDSLKLIVDRERERESRVINKWSSFSLYWMWDSAWWAHSDDTQGSKVKNTLDNHIIAMKILKYIELLWFVTWLFRAEQCLSISLVVNNIQNSLKLRKITTRQGCLPWRSGTESITTTVAGSIPTRKNELFF